MDTNKWVKDSKGWCYLGADGKMVKNSWKKDSKGWCYVGADGYMVTNAFAADSHGQCYIGSDGYMITSTKWVKVDGAWYHVTKGYMDTSKWFKDSKGWCYVGEDGKMVTNCFAPDSKGDCYVNASGYMDTSTKWVKVDGVWYHITKGYMDTSKWFKDSKGWCYVGDDGKMLTNGFAKDSKGNVWVGENGYMDTESKLVEYEGDTYGVVDGYMLINDSLEIDGKTYNFGWDGKLLPDYGFTVSIDGTEVPAEDITTELGAYDASYTDWQTGELVENHIPVMTVKVPFDTQSVSITLNDCFGEYQSYIYDVAQGENGYIDMGFGEATTIGGMDSVVATAGVSYTASVLPEGQVYRIQTKYDENWNSSNLYVIAFDVQPDPSIELAITNNTGMFKAVTAKAIANDDGSAKLTFALSGSGYAWLYKGTYEEAVAANDEIAAGIAAGEGSGKLIKGETNADGKLEFKMDVAADELGTDVPVVAISNSYYNKFLNGENPLERAYYPRQLNLNLDEATLVTGDFATSKALEVTNNYKMFKVTDATLDTVGGPNSNGYVKNLVITMSSGSYTKAYVGTAAQAEADASGAVDIAEGNVFTLKMLWMGTAGNPASTVKLWNDGEPFVVSFWSAKNSAWYERQLILSEAEATLVTDEIPTATVNVTGQDQENTLVRVDGKLAVFNGLKVSATKAASYGFTKPASVANKVTALDVLVAMHEELYGEDFADNPSDYLVYSTGMMRKVFGIESTDFMFWVNDQFPAYDDQPGTGSLVDDTVVKDGDSLRFFGIDGGFYGFDVTCLRFDEAAYAAHEGDSIDIAVDYNYAMSGMSGMPPSDWEPAEDAVVALKDSDDETVAEAIADEDGNATFVNVAPGDYYAVVSEFTEPQYDGESFSTPYATVTVSAHEWDAGTITMPTFEAAGSTVHTCTVDGCTATKSDPIAKYSFSATAGGEAVPAEDITIVPDGYDASYTDWQTGELVESHIPLVTVKVPADQPVAIALGESFGEYQSYIYDVAQGENGYIDMGFGEATTIGGMDSVVATAGVSYTASVLPEGQVYRIQTKYDENWVSYNLYAIAFVIDEPPLTPLEQVLASIGGLSNDPREITADDIEAIEAIQAAYEALSAEDQAVVDATFNHPSGDGQSYGRILEAALWAARSYAIDDTTTLAEGTYTPTSSQSNKGKSDSSRVRNWWVESVEVSADGHATAYIYVTSGDATASKLTSYPSVWVGGQTIDRDANNNYAIPVDLNGTTYFGGISSSMPRPIMYSLTCEIDETPAPQPIELSDGTYNANGLETAVLSMYHFHDAQVVIKGDDAWLITTEDTDNTVKRFDGMAYGPQSQILDPSDETNHTLVAGTVTATVVPVYQEDGTTLLTRTFVLPVPKSVFENGEDIYYMIKYVDGYSASHDGDWYKASGGDYYLTGYTLEKVSDSTVLPGE
ncbi:MAG: hypothetical protein K6G78_03775, partial [bacterium]|nr:hypothetical protein [bacterium]